MQQCYLILGSPRCGSSCFTACLNICGVSIGCTPTSVKDQFNVKGYYENYNILNFNQQVLSSVNSDIFGDRLTEAQVEKTHQYRENLQTIIKSEFGGLEHFAIKDPRIILLEKLYLGVLIKDNDIELSFIILKRNSWSVIKSMHRMFGFSEKEGLSQYFKFYNLIDELVKGKSIIEVNFEDLFTSPVSVMQNVCNFLKVDFNYERQNQVISFVEKGLVNF